METKLEVCIDNLAGLEACMQGKADRIELCSSLVQGGLTPETYLMRHALNAAIPMRMMVRPKSGNFHYSSRDLKQMKGDIDMARSFGFEGVVFGATLVNGTIDQAFLEQLVTYAFGLKKTLHRAIDTVTDPVGAVNIAINLGFDCILSSGGFDTANEGLFVLKEMHSRALGKIEIMPGSGVNPENAQKIAKNSNFNWLHSSCSSLLENSPFTDANKIISIKNEINY
ncbi:copper homeostasis protein CutC [Candidatus Pseudothioglobus sp. Uisw_050_01]|uniref:copper homeostasis protein CutC n=1 Tax=Candidatus Pseudothioglobus sp. Uisw_050_01 TaxID=3230997 RepID=UPI003A843B12